MNDFVKNLLSFPKFLALISLGVLSTFFQPLVKAMQHPVTAIASITAIVGMFISTILILRAMLGLDALTY
jgi:uncharacterized membrane protein YjjP (DUF1212 family)